MILNKYLFSFAILALSLTFVLQYQPFQQDLNQSQDRLYLEQWNLWKQKNGRYYADPNLQIYRFSAFQENFNKVRYQDTNQLYSLGLTVFSDLFPAQFRAIYGTNKLAEIMPQKTQNLETAEKKLEKTNVENLQQVIYVNWVDQGVVKPPQFSGYCQSSYAFAAVDTIESLYEVSAGVTVDLSVQQVVSCSNPNQNGCLGGTIQQAFDYISNNTLATTSAYPYTSTQGDAGQCQNLSGKQKIGGYDAIPYNCNYIANNIQSSPIATCINFSPQLMLYNGGYFDGTDCQYPTTPLCFQIVGMGFNSFWILKGSFGTNWGSNGYLYIGFNDVCMMCSQALQPNL